MNKKNITLFCGHAGSGKDYNCNGMYNAINEDSGIEGVAMKIKFAEPIIALAAKITKQKLKNKFVYEKWKKIPENRQLLIDIGWGMKESFGDSIFGIYARKRIVEADDNVVHFLISDFRFLEELDPLRELKGYNINIFFCDYHSDRYNDSIKDKSEDIPRILKKANAPVNTPMDLTTFYELYYSAAKHI